MKDKPFTIASFEMDKRVEDRLAAGGEKFDSEQVILRKLSALARFFDENGLAARRLTAADGTVDRTGKAASANALELPAGIVTVNDWGLRPTVEANGGSPGDPMPVARRYVGY